MLSTTEERQAQELYRQLRDMLAPAPEEAEFVRDGQQLAAMLGVSRTTAWALAKRSDFPKAIRLGRALRLRRRAEVRGWMQAQAEEPGRAR